MSDPFSEYFYNHKDNPEILKLWIEKICKLKSNENFCTLVDDWRSEGLHNDDSTLCVVEFDKKLELTITHQDDIEELIKNEKESTDEELAEQLTESCIVVCQKGQNMIGESSENMSDEPMNVGKVSEQFVEENNLGTGNNEENTVVEEKDDSIANSIQQISSHAKVSTQPDGVSASESVKEIFGRKKNELIRMFNCNNPSIDDLRKFKDKISKFLEDWQNEIVTLFVGTKK